MQDLISTLDEIVRQDFKYFSESGNYQFKETQEPDHPITIIKTCSSKTTCYTFDVGIKDSLRLYFSLHS